MKRSEIIRAFSVHFLTAAGAGCAMLALLAAGEENWATMVLWLVVALIVDGIDGPLARKWDTPGLAPAIDGVLLDLIIDYLTYVFIPLYALYVSGLLPGWMGWLTVILVPYASALYFADTHMKTTDNSFSGFPGCWNMVVLVLLTVEPGPWACLIVMMVLIPAMFLRIRFVHPVRTEMWRPLTLPIALAWCGLAAHAGWHDFQVGALTATLFVAASLYLLLAGIVQQVFFGAKL